MLAFSTIVLLLGVIFIEVRLSNHKNNAEITYANLYVEPTWPVTRSGEDQNSLSQAISSYLNGNREKALRKLKSLNTDESRYWVAEIYAKEMKMDSLLKYISDTNSEDKLIRDKALYLKIMAMLINNNLNEAESQLDTAPIDFDPWYRQKLLENTK